MYKPLNDPISAGIWYGRFRESVFDRTESCNAKLPKEVDFWHGGAAYMPFLNIRAVLSPIRNIHWLLEVWNDWKNG